MALSLVNRYSSLSVGDCLSSYSKPEEEQSNLMGSSLVDIPLSDNHQRTFAVPPGIQVSK